MRAAPNIVHMRKPSPTETWQHDNVCYNSSPRWRDRVFRPQSNIYIHADDHGLGIWCVLCIQNMSFSTHLHSIPPCTLTWKCFLKSITDPCKLLFGNMRWLLYSRVRNRPKISCGNMEMKSKSVSLSLQMCGL